MRFAQYDSREIKTQYFNGAWYVVRRDMYPHTTYSPGHYHDPLGKYDYCDAPKCLRSIQHTRQGSCTWVGIRQGTSADAGFAVRRYEHPDTEVPE